MTSIDDDLEPGVDAAEFAGVLVHSTLAERRPVADFERLGRMLAQADLIVTARTSERLLVGVARAPNAETYSLHVGLTRHESCGAAPRIKR